MLCGDGLDSANMHMLKNKLKRKIRLLLVMPIEEGRKLPLSRILDFASFEEE